MLRVVDAYCIACDEVRKHEVHVADPGSCACRVCGHVEQMVKPLGSA